MSINSLNLFSYLGKQTNNYRIPVPLLSDTVSDIEPIIVDDVIPFVQHPLFDNIKFEDINVESSIEKVSFLLSNLDNFDYKKESKWSWKVTFSKDLSYFIFTINFYRSSDSTEYIIEFHQYSGERNFTHSRIIKFVKEFLKKNLNENLNFEDKTSELNKNMSKPYFINGFNDEQSYKNSLIPLIAFDYNYSRFTYLGIINYSNAPNIEACIEGVHMLHGLLLNSRLKIYYDEELNELTINAIKRYLNNVFTCNNAIILIKCFIKLDFVNINNLLSSDVIFKLFNLINENENPENIQYHREAALVIIELLSCDKFRNKLINNKNNFDFENWKIKNSEINDTKLRNYSQKIISILSNVYN
jgi:hypothetical protein